MSLKDRLIDMIRANGPMPVSVYMQLCLHDPMEGYYTTRPGLGQDFITAPEISQVFGELIGLWALHEWQAMGQHPTALVELGPGRGTLMKDALRALSGKEFLEAMQLYFLEASPALSALQKEAISEASPIHIDELSEAPIGHTLIIANEYLDCLPARQFVQSEGEWHERVVGLNEDGEIAFGLAVDRSPNDQANMHGAAEVQPGLELLIDQLVRRHQAGDVYRALFIDYGTADGAAGDAQALIKASLKALARNV